MSGILFGRNKLRDKYQVVFDDKEMTVLYHAGSSQDLIVSFTGVGRSTGGIDLQTPEFSKSGFDCSALYVIDKHRSWGNRLNWQELETIVRDKRADGRCITLGNSMGGFLAVLMADRIDADVSISFVPQWSVAPQIVPFEKRWNKHRRHIKQFHYPSLEHCFSNGCRFFVFCGSDSQDVKHLELFPSDADNLHRYHLTCGDHNVSRLLKENDVLYPVIAACLEGRDVGTILSGADLDYRKL